MKLNVCKFVKGVNFETLCELRWGRCWGDEEEEEEKGFGKLIKHILRFYFKFK